LLAIFLALIPGRSLIYWHLGTGVNWTASQSLAVVSLPFRSDYFDRMLLFSCLSLGILLGVFYSSLLVISVANRKLPDSDPYQRLVRSYVKWVDRWPATIRLLLPGLIGAAGWVVLYPLLEKQGIVPAASSPWIIWKQAGVLGLVAFLSWKYVLITVLFLHLLNSYLYLGSNPFWMFINATARNLMHPFRWLPIRLGKFDFVPILLIVLIVFASESAADRLPLIFQRIH
jgi:uncharacterized protein YggT (Ycf19 family)